MGDNNKRELKLSTSKDWDAWLSIIKAKAHGRDVWNLLDPSSITKPPNQPIKPTEPDLDAQKGVDFAEKHARYKIEMGKYKQQYKEYEKQKEGLAKVTDLILATISVANITYIQKVEVHPWDQLVALKARLAPTTAARSFELEQQYHRLAKGPSNRQNIDQWLDDYMKMYTLGKEAGIAECTDGKRVYRDFLLSIEKMAPTFAEMRQILSDALADHHAALIKAIDDFRQHMRLKEAQKGKGASHSAFAADDGNGKPSFKGKSQTPRACVCDLVHWFSECPYLNKAIRGSNWKPDPAIQAKIDEILKTNPGKKAAIERSLAKNAEYVVKAAKKAAEGQSNSTVGAFTAMIWKPVDGQYKNVGAFPAISATFFGDNDEYYLRSSWIMDHGSGIHVANETMKSRFIKDRNCTDGSMIISGNGPLPIEAYGHMEIHVHTPAGPRTMTLLEVCYVPGFMANIVPGSILEDKGVHFDTQHRHLRRNGIPFVNLTRSGGHYVIEDNTASAPPQGVFATAKAVRAATALQWHQLMAHANDEAIQHLSRAAEGVEFTNKESAPATNKCEECALSKAHRIISRSLLKSETSDKPFYRITYDLIDMNTAMNKDRWISHFACSETGFHMVYTHKLKSEAVEVIIRAIHTIETRYKGRVVFFRSDGERALGDEFDAFLALKGITYESSAPDTPAQNGHIERLGAILLLKSRAMRIQAGLPEYLWPWITQTAGYLMNRTPSKKHDWKTPFELVTGSKPNLAHIIQFGAKAYPIDKHIPRREKMRAKAHIGFLVGYDSTNIFNIWIPSQRKVIRTRDVTFNEDKQYRPNEVDAAQLISEPFLQNDTLDIPQAEINRLMTDELSSESEDELFEALTGSIVQPEASKGAGNEASYLPSPASSSRGEDTPAPTASEASTSAPSTRTPSPSASAAPSSDQPPVTRPQRQNHDGNRSFLREEDIMPEGQKRVRKPNTRREAYYTALNEAFTGGLQAYLSSFATSLTKEKRPHRDNLPPEPKYYNQMLKHPEAKGFIKAIDVEISPLISKRTWKDSSFAEAKAANKVPIPTTWVFKYKFDNEGYLIKHKARLCARGDLQHTDQDVYAATLAIKIFRAIYSLEESSPVFGKHLDQSSKDRN